MGTYIIDATLTRIDDGGNSSRVQFTSYSHILVDRKDELVI